jgi:polysaccharide export outer membrane protein
MRVSHLLRDARTDLLREADLSFALVVSYQNALLDIAVTQFSLVDAITNPGSDRDPVLKEFDEVLVFALPELEGVEADTKNARQSLLEPVIAKLRAQAREDEPVQTVSISGAVRAPGTYPLFANTTATALIRAAGGLKDSAFSTSAELRSVREMRDGTMGADYKEIDIDRALQGRGDPVLSSRDHLTVRDIPDWSPSDRVTISGEVKFPGEYLIQKGETLADVIQRAGGLTDEAFPEAAVFTREEIARREAERSRAFAADIRQTYASRLLTEETTTNTLADISQITQALEGFEGRGRMLIDLPLALAGDTAADVEVSDGDTLVIPKRVNTVTVVGEVYQQGTHTFASANRLEDYLSLSAGLTARADDKAIYVVKANGSVAMLESSWWRFGGASQRLSPGDTIVVPVNSQYKESLASWREITQIVYQSLISVAAVANL